jgi:hypothetical protein
LNNIRNLGLACSNFASANNDRLPLLEDSPFLATPTNANGATLPGIRGEALWGPGGVGGNYNPGKSWVAQIIGYMDQQAIARAIIQNGGIFNPNTGVPFVYPASTTSPSLTDASNTNLPVIGPLTCPDDSNNFQLQGGLSYAANAGYMTSFAFQNTNTVEGAYGLVGLDYGTGAHDSTLIAWGALSPLLPSAPSIYTIGPNDYAIAHATGVFWRNDVSGFRMTQDFVQSGDGTSNTLLLAENLDAGYWVDLQRTTRANLSNSTVYLPFRRDLQTPYIGFGIFVSVVTTPAAFTPDTTKPTGAFGTACPNNAQPCNNFLTTQTVPPSSVAWALEDPVVSTATNQENATINSNVLTATVGQAARPSSNHPGIVCFCFVDGHALPLSQNMDAGVYMRAITPAGTRYGQQIDGDIR